jgi:hypothetical protein
MRGKESCRYGLGGRGERDLRQRDDFEDLDINVNIKLKFI